MSFDNTKYDVEVNAVSYRVRSYQKQALNAFIPRIGGGDQNETEFNLLRSRTIEGFDGGQLQRFFKDKNSVFATEGLYPIYDDSVLYPVNAFSGVTSPVIPDKGIVTAWVRDGLYVYIAKISYNSPTTSIKRIDNAGTVTTLTLPASLSSRRVSSLCVWDGYLMAATTDGSSLWQMNIQSTTTFTEITNGSSGNDADPYLLCTYNGQLYCTNATTAAINSKIYRYTGTISTKSFTTVGTIPSYVSSLGEADGGKTRFFVFSGRLCLTRLDGLWAYDLIRVYPIEDLTGQENTSNYSFAVVLKNVLYYWMPDGMYRNTTSLIEKLYDISEIGTPVDVCTGKNRVWILYKNSSNGSSRYDRAMGYDYASGNNVDGRVAVFNGSALYTYGRTSTFVKNPATEDFSGQEESHRIIWFNDNLYVMLNYSKLGTYHKCSTLESALTGQKAWRIVTSIDDADFAMVDKALENTEVVLDGNLSAIDSSDEINISFRNTDFDTTAGWASLGTLDNLALYTKVRTLILNPAGVGYRQLQLRLTGLTTAGYGISKIVSRYRIVPELKWQWQMTLLCYGDDPLEPLKLADGTAGAQTVEALRGNLYSAASQEFPVKFIDVDPLVLDTTIDSDDTDVILESVSLVKDPGGSFFSFLGSGFFIQIDDEIILCDGKIALTNEISVLQRGALSTTPAAHTAGASVFLVYQTNIDIKNENIDIQPGAIAANISRQTEVTITLQEI